MQTTTTATDTALPSFAREGLDTVQPGDALAIVRYSRYGSTGPRVHRTTCSAVTRTQVHVGAGEGGVIRFRKSDGAEIGNLNHSTVRRWTAEDDARVLGEQLRLELDRRVAELTAKIRDTRLDNGALADLLGAVTSTLSLASGQNALVESPRAPFAEQLLVVSRASKEVARG